MLQVVVFSLANESYGLPIAQVQEIILYRAPRSIPSPAASIRGVINLRGRIIPICDPHGELVDAVATERDGDAAQIVIVDTAHGTVGLIVDGVDHVLTVTDEQIEIGAGERRDYVTGIAKIGNDLIVLLDPDALATSLFARSDLAA
jgi:purine-binding chemotaxis protein CheW